MSSWWATSSIRPSSREAPSIDGELLGGRRRGQLVLRLDAEQADTCVGQTVQHPQHRPEDRDVGPVGQRQGEQRALGRSDGDVLRHHLADHHVEEGDDRQRDDEPDGVEQPHGDVDHPLQRPLDEASDGGLGDVAEQQRRHRDAELGPRQLHVEVPHRAHRDASRCAAVLRHRLELRAPAGDEGELDGHEEAVRDQQRGPRRGRGCAITGLPPPRRRADPTRRRQTVATRSSSSATTSTCQPSWSKPSPASGMRPSWSSTKPGQRLVVAVRDDEPAGVEHLVGVQRAVEQPLTGALHPVRRRRRAVVLVVDLADDLLEHVLERDDPRSAPVLVDDDRQVRCPRDAGRRAGRPGRASRAPRRPAP